jgi:hypothetical protein
MGAKIFIALDLYIQMNELRRSIGRRVALFQSFAQQELLIGPAETVRSRIDRH